MKEESTAYDAFVEMGQLAQTKRILLMVGEQRYGKPTQDVRDRIEDLNDIAQLETLVIQHTRYRSWEGLLKSLNRATPT